MKTKKKKKKKREMKVQSNERLCVQKAVVQKNLKSPSREKVFQESESHQEDEMIHKRVRKRSKRAC
jgi:hypothetical protein